MSVSSRSSLPHILRLSVGCLLTALLLTGCTRLHTIPLGEHESFYERVTRAAEGRTVTISLQNGNDVRASNVRIAPDSVRWVVPDAWTRQFTQPRAVPTSEVREITIRKRTRGALIGAVLGAAAVMAFTAVPALTQQEKGSILLITGLFSIAGAGGGAYAGARRGERDIYVFSEYLEGTERYRIEQLLEGKSPGVAELIDQLRTTIRGIDTRRIEEEITETNIVYLSDDRQFCYLVPDDTMVRVYLSARPVDVDDPMGLVRPWSTSDSWFSIVPGGDLDYARLLISQVYSRTD